jgi:hypothetical protein
MAKIVYACVRNTSHAPLIKKRIESIIDKLVPDNIPEARCKLVDKGEIIYGISTYTSQVAETESGVRLGIAYNDSGKWWKPKSGHPEGSYAIIRADSDFVEAITDMACTHAIWYYKDEDVFIAGTSQRAVIKVAGQFEIEKRNIPWMLSSGSLAPSLSWSKNVHFVEADGAVLLNRNTWQVSSSCNRVEFRIDKSTDKQFKEEFKRSLLDSFRNYGVDLSTCILPISGGYDSRGIACLFKETGRDISKLDSITWGNGSSLHNKNSDGYLGAAIAKSLGMPHSFLKTDTTKEPVEAVLERFIRCSEGRVDHVAGYADGMGIWRKIFETGELNVLRGDEPFGGFESGSMLRSRLVTGMKLCEDYSNLQDYEEYGFEKQVLAEHLIPIPGKDTTATYRDKLYQGYRMPTTLSALSDVKYAYTEILNPCLTRQIIGQARRLPDHLRTEKVLYKKIIDELSPKIPYASEEAISYDILNTPDAVRLFCSEISSDYMRQLFPEAFLGKILADLQKPAGATDTGMLGKLKKAVNRNLPPAVKDKLRKSIHKPAVEASRLAFRIYLTGRAYKMYMEDVADNERIKQHQLHEELQPQMD